MGLIRWLLFGLALLPFAEIAAFIGVATAIGAFRAFVLLAGLCLLGVVLMRHFGLAQLNRVRLHVTEGGFQTLHIAEGSLAPFVAALLLAIPGFITDAAALAILVMVLLARLGVVRGAPPRPAGPADGGVVDLAPGEWHAEPQPRLGADPAPRPRPDGGTGDGPRRPDAQDPP